MIKHPIPPLYDEKSKILILGSFPSVKSREEMFFYGHKQNRFWAVLAKVLECDVPGNIEEKRALLIKHNIALWDVIAQCDIEASSDSSIKNVTVNDINIILESARIVEIFVNGKTAEKYYNKYLRGATGREAICLPSTSPANASWSMERLTKAWEVIKTVL